MKIEIRADGTHISGYVNVPEKKSNPICTKTHGKVIETIEPGTFQRAIDRARNIRLTVDHGSDTYASTEDGTLTIYEDQIGLYADAIISDPLLIKTAKDGKIRGWSFGFTVNRDTVDHPVGSAYPLRRVSDINLDHVSIVVNQYPVYNATSWELRDGCTSQKSGRLMDANAEYRKRVEAAKSH